jgi:hypothetical protein
LGGPGTLFQKGSWPPEAKVDGEFGTCMGLDNKFYIVYNSILRRTMKMFRKIAAKK